MKLLTLILGTSLLLSACGQSNTPSPSPSASVSAVPSETVTLTIRPTVETNDTMLEKVEALQKEGKLKDVMVMESYPVQIKATGSEALLKELMEMANPSTGTYTIKSIEEGSSLVDTAGQRVVKNAEELKTLWVDYHGESESVPSIDFEKETIVAVFAGEKPTAGFSISVTKAMLSGTELKVYYKLEEPPKDAFVAQVIIYPSQVASIGIPSDGFETVSFIEE